MLVLGVVLKRCGGVSLHSYGSQSDGCIGGGWTRLWRVRETTWVVPDMSEACCSPVEASSTCNLMSELSWEK